MQRCWYISVHDQGQAGFLAEAKYIDTLSDVILCLEVERKTLMIKKAFLEVYRGDPGEFATAPLASLEGITAYFGSGKQLRQDLGDYPALLVMAIHAVTAVIQAEVAFYRERGFSSASDYDDFWDEKYKNSCVYYSNLDRVRNRFMDHIAKYKFGRVLFHRLLLTSLEVSGEKSKVHGHLMDTFHEMKLAIEMDEGYKIKKVSGDIIRCPDLVCLDALTNLEGLRDLELNSEELKRYQRICDRKASCTHMVQLVQEAVFTLDIYLKSIEQGIAR